MENKEEPILLQFRPSPSEENDVKEKVPLRTEDKDVENVIETSDKVDDNARGQWGSKMDFLLSTIGFAVDLANVFRFPTTCYRNGGGAFLIPYFLMLAFLAFPVFYMELVLGQYHKRGCLGIWKICPILKGLGWSSCFMNVLVAIYYNVAIAWSVYYLFASFSRTLPWTLCGQSWNTQHCFLGALGNNTSANDSEVWGGGLSHGHFNPNTTLKFTPAAEYFQHEVLQVQNSTGLHDMGAVKWDLSLCLLLVFIILFFCMFKGVQSLGKAVWVTAILPYIVLGILLIRGCMLKGSWEGILFFIKPEFGALLKPNVWIDAAIQISFSIGIGFGVHTAYASYNPFNNNVYRDCLVAGLVNSFTSLFSGFVVFAFLGYLSQEMDLPIPSVVNDNTGLIFVVYPQALSTLPGAQFFSVLFFVMLMSLGLDSAFGALESMLTAIRDEFNSFFLKFKYNREILTGVFITCLYLFSLPNASYGGLYLTTFLEKFSAGDALLVVVFFQCIAVAWIYGNHNFAEDVKEMLHNKPSIYWRFMWKFGSPLIVLSVLITSIASPQPLTVSLLEKVYTYPAWAMALGKTMVTCAALIIPIGVVVQLIRAGGRNMKERLLLSISPESEHAAILEEGTGKRAKARHWMGI